MKHSFRELRLNTTLHHCIRVLIAMLGVVLGCWFFNSTQYIHPLILGVIASAVAQTDDNLSGRISALTTTLICFIITTCSVEILFNTPILFGIGLFISCFTFTMLGAISSRYATISFASLLIAVYTMLGASASVNWWTQPLYLLSGAAWYGLISLIWVAIWPMQPIQQRLIALFDALAIYLEHKSALFHPSTDQSEDALRLRDANENAKVVDTLNLTKFTILSHIRGKRLHHTSLQYLKIYYLAQDIHERANSSHCRYEDMAQTFFYSDIMFRFQHLLRLQAQGCRDASESLFDSSASLENAERTQAHNELHQSLAYLKQHASLQTQSLLPQLEYLSNNLTTIERQLLNVCERSENEVINRDYFDPHAHTLREKWTRFKNKISPKSLLFRHAFRLSLALTLGYGIVQGLKQIAGFSFTNGYWILLTILFVCQANYSATRSKLNQRVLGTLIGLMFGIPLIALFPNMDVQLALMVIFGVLFFAFRATQYTAATTFITMLVVISFNQQGNGFDVIAPRLFDTMIGCVISVFTVRFVLPDWQAHRLRHIMTDAIRANRDYLSMIIAQYRIGKQDNQPYRNKRREAHNNDAQLSSAITNMLAEPGRYQTAIDESFRFLCLNHAMLNYISALGAHRIQIDESEIHHLVSKSHQDIQRQLDYLIQILSGEDNLTAPKIDDSLGQELERWRDGHHPDALMILQQLHLIQRIMPELQTLTEQIGKIALAKKMI